MTKILIIIITKIRELRNITVMAKFDMKRNGKNPKDILDGCIL